jgi:hypothetical protein
MYEDGMTYARITDLFKEEEIDRARLLFFECKGSNEFYKRCTTEVVEPIISRISEHTRHRNSAEYWAYCLAIYLGTVREGKG